MLYYNKDAFKRAGLDSEQSPQTWRQLAASGVKLHKAGLTCRYVNGGYQGWIQIENFSVWHALPVAIQDNGFAGADARLVFNGPLQVKHIQRLVDMLKNGSGAYFGRDNAYMAKFYGGECGMPLAPLVRCRPCVSTPNSIMASA